MVIVLLKEISIEVIRKCPNNCLHCSSCSSRECSEMMPLEVFKEVVVDAASLGAETICLSGGEPFLHKDFVELIKWVYYHGLNCYVYTSGIVLDSSGKLSSFSLETVQEISKYVNKLIFNIEAACEETYDKIMGTNNSFLLMQESINRAVQASITVEAHFVPMKLNYNEIEPVVELCERLHVSRLSFLRLVLHGRAKVNKPRIQLTTAEEAIVKSKLRDLQKQSRIAIRIGVPLLSDKNPCAKCEAANGKLNIKYDGKVYPCEVFKNFSQLQELLCCQPCNIYDERLTDIYEKSPYLQHIRDISRCYLLKGAEDLCVGQYLLNKSEKEDLVNE